VIEDLWPTNAFFLFVRQHPRNQVLYFLGSLGVGRKAELLGFDCFLEILLGIGVPGSFAVKHLVEEHSE
jgi:hypothetical protein